MTATEAGSAMMNAFKGHDHRRLAGPDSVQCPDQPTENYCDCSGDCTGHPEFCGCADAQACCAAHESAGEQHHDTCYCDEYCQFLGNCCEDFVDTCVPDFVQPASLPAVAANGTVFAPARPFCTNDTKADGTPITWPFLCGAGANAGGFPPC